MSVKYEPPMRINIAIPNHLKRGYGIDSTEIYGSNLKVRVNLAERDLIDEEAKQLGINLSAFVRCAVVYTARALREHRESHLNVQEPEPHDPD